MLYKKSLWGMLVIVQIFFPMQSSAKDMEFSAVKVFVSNYSPTGATYPFTRVRELAKTTINSSDALYVKDLYGWLNSWKDASSQTIDPNNSRVSLIFDFHIKDSSRVITFISDGERLCELGGGCRMVDEHFREKFYFSNGDWERVDVLAQ